VRKDRRLCRTCVSYYLERYGHCVLIGKRVQGWIGGKPCWQRRTKKPNNSSTGQEPA
jgi:hypothetical protein